MATDADPGDRAKQRRAAFSSERRFPDLQRKPVWRERIEALASVDIYLRHADGRLEQVAFGEPSGASDVVGQDAVRTAGKPTTAPPRFVQRGLALIRAAASARGSVTSLTLVCPPGFRTPVFSLPVVIDESGALADALLCTLPSGHVRQRRACFVECRERAGGASVVLIVEGKASAQMPDLCGTAKVDVLAAALWCLKGRDGAQRHGEP